MTLLRAEVGDSSSIATRPGVGTLLLLGDNSSANLEFIMVNGDCIICLGEFASIIVTAFYVLHMLMPHLLHVTISQQQTAHTEAAFIVADDHINLKTVLPKFYEHVSCNTRGNKKTLDHVYTNMAGADTATPLPHLRQSDHLFLFLSP